MSAITPTKSSISQLPNTEVLLTPDSFTSPSVNHANTSLTHVQKSASATPNASMNASNNEILTPGSLPLPPVSSKEEASLQGLEVGPLVDIDEQEPLATSEKISNHNVVGTMVNVMQRAHHSSSSSPSREVAEILAPDTNRTNECRPHSTKFFNFECMVPDDVIFLNDFR